MPMASFGIHVQPVDDNAGTTLASLNADRHFALASTTKLVTSLAALDLLGPAYRWRAEGLVASPARVVRMLDPRAFNRNALRVSVQPGSGEKAVVTVQPRPPGVTVVGDVYMGGGACNAWAQWRQDKPGELWVRGRWDTSCGRRDIALVRPRVPATSVKLASVASVDLPALDLRRVIHGMNKTSDNRVARSLMLRLAPSVGGLEAARQRVQGWLRTQGLVDGDIRIEQGSGESRLEQGKPRAMVQLLRRAWRRDTSRAFVDSLPIAGVDGTLAHRMQRGEAAGHAFLKTGTLLDTRALAGYVQARSGRVYAVAAMVNHPDAARATPALDALIEWVAKNG
jgi:D-alanyl-D-alanine carboxypeptidase/D-alanyl-D-alanine-endopeptidase (penicillin-binding protein 4)